MTQAQTSTQTVKSKTAVTPELVRQVADKVYALWQRDVQIEQERQRRPEPRWGRR